MKGRAIRFALFAVLILLGVLMLIPILFTVVNSFMTQAQISGSYRMADSGAASTWTYKRGMSFVPFPFVLDQYFEILAYQFSYFRMFWESMKIAVIITFFQLIVSTVTGFFLGMYDFKGKTIVFGLYLAALFLPFSVTLLPNYLLMKDLGLFDTQWAIIIPAIFSPLGTLLVTMFVQNISHEIYEAASMETNSYFIMLRRIMLPQMIPAIGALLTLTFAEAWNMVEQPLALIDNPLLRPLSVSLNSIYGSLPQFAAAVIYIAPVIFLFLYFEDSIMEEISAATIHQ